MKQAGIQIHIPNPCHEKWESMQPKSEGKFCGSCSKTVVDFSGKTDNEIYAYRQTNQDQNLCGHFRKSQVNRPLRLKINIREIPRRLSFTHIFAISVFLVFGTLLFSCTDYENKKLTDIEITGVDTTKIASAIQESDSIPANTAIDNSFLAEEPYLTGDVYYIETPAEINKEDSATVYVKGKLRFSTDSGSLKNFPEEVEDTLFINKLQDTVATKELLMGYILPNPTNQDPVGKQTDIPEINQTNTETFSSNENLNSFSINVFPNPGRGEFKLQYQLRISADIHVRLYSLEGRLLKTLVKVPQQHSGNYVLPFYLNEFPNGTYILFTTMNSEVISQRIIKYD